MQTTITIAITAAGLAIPVLLWMYEHRRENQLRIVTELIPEAEAAVALVLDAYRFEITTGRSETEELDRALRPVRTSVRKVIAAMWFGGWASRGLAKELEDALRTTLVRFQNEGPVVDVTLFAEEVQWPTPQCERLIDLLEQVQQTLLRKRREAPP